MSKTKDQIEDMQFIKAMAVVFLLVFSFSSIVYATPLEHKVGDTVSITYVCWDEAAVKAIAAEATLREDGDNTVDAVMIALELEGRCGMVPFNLGFVIQEKILNYTDIFNREMVVWRVNIKMDPGKQDFYTWGTKYRDAQEV